ncbi:unnamed protein product [Brassica oleracea]
MDGSKTFSFGLSKERRGRFSEQRTPITIQVSLPLSSDELVLSLLFLVVVSNNGVVVTFVGVSIGLLEIDVVLGVINELCQQESSIERHLNRRVVGKMRIMFSK